jgi:hypothetical protein
MLLRDADWGDVVRFGVEHLFVRSRENGLRRRLQDVDGRGLLRRVLLRHGPL